MISTGMKAMRYSHLKSFQSLAQVIGKPNSKIIGKQAVGLV